VIAATVGGCAGGATPLQPKRPVTAQWPPTVVVLPVRPIVTASALVAPTETVPSVPEPAFAPASRERLPPAALVAPPAPARTVRSPPAVSAVVDASTEMTWLTSFAKVWSVPIVTAPPKCARPARTRSA